MPQTITLFIRLEDQPTDPASDPDLLYKRGDIFQVHIYTGATPKDGADFGLVIVTDVPDDLTIDHLRTVFTSIDADYDKDGHAINIRGRRIFNINIDSLSVNEKNTLTGNRTRMLNWDAAQFLSRSDIKGTKNRKIIMADLYEDYG